MSGGTGDGDPDGFDLDGGALGSGHTSGGGTGGGDGFVPGSGGTGGGGGGGGNPGESLGSGRPEGGEGARRGGRHRLLVGVAVVAAVAAVAVPLGVLGLGGGQAGGPVDPEPLPGVRLVAQLTEFDACPAFLSYVQGAALERMSVQGVPEPTLPPGTAVDEDALSAPGDAQTRTQADGRAGAAGMPAPAPASGSASGPAPRTREFSGTNVQVADVDEPDTVKTDGRLLVSLEGDRLRIVDAVTPRLRGVLTFAEPVQEFLLVGDKAVVLGTRQQIYALPEPVPSPAVPPLGPDAGGGSAPVPPRVAVPPGDTIPPGAGADIAPAPPDAGGGFAPVPPDDTAPPSAGRRFAPIPPGDVKPVAPVPPDDVVVSPGGGRVLPGPPAGETTVTVVDLADPDRPRVLRTFRLTGTQVAARVVAGEIRLVLRTDPPVPFWPVPPGAVGSGAVSPGRVDSPGAGEVTDSTRTLIEQTTADDWLPSYRIEGDGAPPSPAHPLVACEDVLRPEDPTSLSMITVLTVDPDADRPGRATSVVGGGDTVYAEETALYVAGTQYPPLHPLPAADTPTDDTPTSGAPSPGTDTDTDTTVPTDAVTQIHQFEVRDPKQARYVASGQVQGRLLNSYALSAADGRLRVATTREWIAGNGTSGNSGNSDNAIVVLEPRDRQLVQVGQVGGLGVGEQIYAVRYLGDVAWVVTFRQTDPLYAVDLSDPTRPAVRGELKLPGFSTYLLPLPDKRLLGIGESADGNGNGTKLALFDISDLAAPRLVDDEVVPGSGPQVTADPHAFLWWAPARLAVVPVVGWGDLRGGPGGQALAFRVDDVISPAGRLGRSGETAPVTRAVVVGDRIFAVSMAGVQVHDLTGLAPGTWLPW